MPTTSSSTIGIPSHDIIGMLEECVAICTDGEKRYSEAALETRELALKEVFLGYAKQRLDLVQTLASEITKLGGTPIQEGTTLGTLHRGFMEVRATIEGHSPSAMIAECERGERGAILRYDRILGRLPIETAYAEPRAMLSAQRAAIDAAHGDMLRRLAQS